ncbi:hypothetical protein NPX99_08425 [Bartonella sp. 220]|uniref:hypothetical protein n=1 Tax=Bartonella sp. 220B TaxID=2967260 RepID=UPI0022A9BB0E|nr:hypothetical protein [Bartonella sp. 220B]MCZ2159258.1 hypothetical protein [Bartonella sp. 220B]
MRKDPLFTMSGIGAEGFLYPSALLPYKPAVKSWAGVEKERERQKREMLYGRKLLGMVIPKIGERPIDKMEMLQQLMQKYQGPATPSAISISPFGSVSFSPSQIGTIVPDGVYHEKKEPYLVPEAEIPFGVGNHSLVLNAQEVDRQALTPVAEAASIPETQPSPVDTRSSFEKFVQSDAYKKLQDLFAGMAASKGGSGWDALASGVKHLNAGDKERQQVNQTVEYLKSQGMSEEEARFMAGNSDALNAFFVQKMSGRNALNYKEEMDSKRQMIELQNSEAISSNMLDDIKRFMDYVNENGDWSTGNLADWLAFFNVPQHRDMKSLLNSIKNRIGIDRLETMRQYSRNGASGFGNLTEKELDILKSYLGEIDYKLGHKELMFRLEKIHEILGKMKSNVLSLLQDRHTKLTEENVMKVTSETASTTPQKMSGNLPVVSRKEDIKNLPVGNRAIVQYGHDSFEIVRDR